MRFGVHVPAIYVQNPESLSGRPGLSPHEAMPSFPLVFESHAVFPSRIREALNELIRFEPRRMALAITLMHAECYSRYGKIGKHDPKGTCDAAMDAKIQVQHEPAAVQPTLKSTWRGFWCFGDQCSKVAGYGEVG